MEQELSSKLQIFIELSENEKKKVYIVLDSYFLCVFM